MSMIDRAKSQDTSRESLSGESVAEQLQQSGVNQAYNLRLGPVTLRLESDITTSFNDNINLANTGRITDIVMTPSSVVHANWKISELNTLTLDLGIGYQMYLLHSQYDSLLISPDSEAEFNFFVGDVIISLYDGFSYQQDPTQIGQLSNSTRLSRFQNDAGVRATWDLNDIVLSVSYDHANLWVTQSAYDYLTNQSDTISPKITIKVDPSINTGISTSFSDVRYEQNFQNNYTTVSAGPFVTATISHNLSVNAQVGGYFSNYSTGGLNGDDEDISSYYASAGVNHRINDALSESLTAGREFLPGLTSNFTQRIYANYADTWQATSTIDVNTNLWWENLDDSDAAVHELSNRYGVGLNVDDNLSKHATLSLGYQYILKDADPSTLSYYQNLGTVGFRYQF
ncbi:MAG TPA: hypothetical protein VGZ93_06035 [Candidatus Methylacidiphilales bacterium]|nr:hypothetical protein [Candidatus Methylacidiphilales bacterium]